MFRFQAWVASLALALIGQASKIGSALFHTSHDSDARRQRLELAAKRHKPRTLDGATESCIAADASL